MRTRPLRLAAVSDIFMSLQLNCSAASAYFDCFDIPIKLFTHVNTAQFAVAP